MTPVRSACDVEAVTRLFTEYAAGIGIDLAYQDFDAELARMPGNYAPPLGELLLAKSEAGEAFGCVGMRPMPHAGCCEMKRLYVAPQARGTGMGIALVRAIGDAAVKRDTLKCGWIRCLPCIRQWRFTRGWDFHLFQHITTRPWPVRCF